MLFRSRTISRKMFAQGPDMLSACVAIESAFSELRCGAIDEKRFGEEIVRAILPFVLDSAINNYGDPQPPVQSCLPFGFIAADLVEPGRLTVHPVTLA